MPHSIPGRASVAVVRRLLLSCLVAFSLLSLAPSVLQTLAPLQVLASAQASEPVYACGVTDASGQNNIFAGSEDFGIQISQNCSTGDGLFITDDGVNTIPYGSLSYWIATAPAGLVITGANVPDAQVGPGTVGTGYVGNFIWTGASQRVISSGSVTIPSMSSGQFGFEVECAPSQGGSCGPAQNAYLFVTDVQLTVAETVGPSLTALGAGNLWYKGASEYVRGGGWPITYSASAPSGIDSMAASEAGQPVSDPTAPAPGCTPNHTVWQQCPGTQTWSPTISLSGSGAQQLVLSATSAAGNTNPYTESIDVDNQQPTVSLSGPAEASSTAGTQYVTATATTGPSGLGAISCSVDQGPEQSYSSSLAQIPVSGAGQHSINCTASNRSFNSAGQVAVSAPASFSMDIGAPTAGSISFGNIIHGLKCKKVTEREKIPAKWVMVRRHGKLVRVHRRAHTKRVKVMKCRERFVKRKVIKLVKVKRHGKIVVVKRTKLEKVPVPPQAVSSSTKQVSYGKSTTVSGILATTDGTALAGRTVQILAAPNNQLGQWSQVAVVTTGADGTWSATLPLGPSRLVEAAYAGDTTTLPSTSNTVTMLVPARIKISITPHQLPWNGVLTIHGHLVGGYIPPDGVAMRVLIGLPHLSHPYLAQSFRTNAAGAFALKFKAFGGGHGVTRYPMWLATTSNESDYAYAKSSSRRINITFGLRTPKKTKKAKAKKRRRRKRRR
jgi:hypothetical protein